MFYKKSLRVMLQIFLVLGVVLPSTTGFPTVWNPVDERLIGSWSATYQKTPLHHYVVPLTITILDHGMLPRTQGPNLLSETWVYDDQVRFRWIRKMAKESTAHHMLWNYVFEGHLKELSDGSVQLQGTLSGAERRIDCKPQSPLDDCLRIKVTGKWTAKKAKP